MYDKLRETLEERSMSVYALSKATGIGSNHLYRALAGYTTLFPGWKTRIADALSCSVDELFPTEEGEQAHE